MIVQLQTARGKVNVEIRDEFTDAAVANSVARELRESKRLDMLKPYTIKGWKWNHENNS